VARTRSPDPPEFGQQSVERARNGRTHTVTTQRDPRRRPAPDLMERRFEADAPDPRRVADTTCVLAGPDFVYLAIVLDVRSRRAVGWSVSETMHTDPVLAAPDVALAPRRPRAGLTCPCRHRASHTDATTSGCPLAAPKSNEPRRRRTTLPAPQHCRTPHRRTSRRPQPTTVLEIAASPSPVDALPRNAYGKVLKTALRDRLVSPSD
jgi:transposase InsO family protein